MGEGLLLKKTEEEVDFPIKKEEWKNRKLCLEEIHQRNGALQIFLVPSHSDISEKDEKIINYCVEKGKN